MPTITTSLDLTVLNNILKQLDGNVADAVAKAAFAIEARAKIKAPVDTGALRASIYTSLKAGDAADASRIEALSRNPDVTITALPVPETNATAYVGPSVEYGAAQEFGSAGRAAHPYLLPAVRETEAEFKKLVSGAVVNG